MASDETKMSLGEPEDPLALYKREADSLGLEGKQKVAYVQERAREDRQAEREKEEKERQAEREKEEKEREREERLKKEEREREERLKREEREREERLKKEERDDKIRKEEREHAESLRKLELEYAKEREERERAERDKERDRENKRLQLEMQGHDHPADANEDVSGTDNAHVCHPHGSQPKLPYFDGKDAEMDAYLFRFEQYATACDWPKDKWSVYLPSLLKGKALQVYHELSLEQSLSYDDLKDRLLKRFQCTEEGFRNRFRQAHPESDENMTGFLTRTSHLLTRWIELADAKTYDGLFDLILREQLLHSCSPALATFLKERKCTSSEDMMDVAENYREAHPGQSMSSKSVNIWASVSVDPPTSVSHTFETSRPRPNSFYRPRGARGSGYTGRSNASYLPHSKFSNHETPIPDSDQHVQKPIVCWQCKKPGHKMVDCPSNTTANEGAAYSKCSECNANSRLIKSCGHGFQHSNSVVTESQPADAFVTCTGQANGKPVTVMLDSGSTTVGIRKSLVNHKHYTGRYEQCKMFSGCVTSLPLAKVHLDTPYFRGSVNACVVDDPTHDVILGRIPGATFTVAASAPVARDGFKFGRRDIPVRRSGKWKTCKRDGGSSVQRDRTAVRKVVPVRDRVHDVYASPYARVYRHHWTGYDDRYLKTQSGFRDRRALSTGRICAGT